MITVPKVVDETNLADYRNGHLNPLMLATAISESNRAFVLSVPPGVGKSHAAHGLTTISKMLGHDLIVYVAPTRALIDEFLASEYFQRFSSEPDKDVLIMEPRPRALCGALDEEWSRLEQQGCSATGHNTLCMGCAHKDECTWKNRWMRLQEPVRMVVLTEAYINLRPNVIDGLIRRFHSTSPLVIIDEGTIFTTDLTRKVTIAELEMFGAAIQAVQATRRSDQRSALSLENWSDWIEVMVSGRGALEDLPPFHLNPLGDDILAVETEGLRLFGEEFRNVQKALIDIKNAWYYAGAFYFSPEINTGCSTLVVLSPYLSREIIEARLGRAVEELEVPRVFRHSQSNFVNIQDGAGSARSMTKPAEFNRVVDFYTALVLRNHFLGHRTVLVARKKYLARIKRHMEDLLSDLGRPMSITMPGEEITDGTSVALINYGIVGVNDFQSFDALYCIGSYYAHPDHVSDVYQQGVPHDNRSELRISGSQIGRAVQATKPSLRDRNRAEGANRFLSVLEQRVVLQAIGRARPFTSQTEIILMQQDDFSDAIGNVRNFESLKQVRNFAGVPTRSEMTRSVLGEQIRLACKEGQSLRKAAKTHGVAPSTAAKARDMPSLEALLKGIEL